MSKLKKEKISMTKENSNSKMDELFEMRGACELTPEELEQVAGGNSADFNVKDWNNYSISEKPLL